MKEATAEMRRKYRWLWLALAAATVMVFVGRSCRKGDEMGDVPVFAVRRGPLTISVTERGTIENRSKAMVASQVERSVTIVSIVEEGTIVEEGDLLVELDSSEFKEKLLEQEILLQNSESALIQAQESLAIGRNQAAADVEKAEYNLRFAEMDLKKYEEGDYPLLLRSADSQITLANEELKKAETQYAWSQKLADKGFITQTEQLGDELSLKRKRIDYEMAKQNRDVLVTYTHERDLAGLKVTVTQFRMALERARRKARADVVKEEANLRAKESAHKQQQSKLEKLVEQIAACRITAPTSGMVVHATSTQQHRYGRNEPLKVGSAVKERQELIELPIGSEMDASLRVQESSLRKIREGLPVQITVDAVPGVRFHGVLTKIPVLPDATRAWLNPDLKIYNCEAELNGGVKHLRPGMTCRGEIIVDEIEVAVYVPLQSVVRIQGALVVYVKEGTDIVARTVKTGMDNGRMIHVLEGLSEGEEVLLAPPLQGSIEEDEPPEKTSADGPDKSPMAVRKKRK